MTSDIRLNAKMLAFAKKTTVSSTEIANQSSDRKTKQPRLANKYYSCWLAIGSTAFTLPVCTETVSSFFPRRPSPRSLNTVAPSKMRSSAHRSVESSLKSSRQRAGFLLLVKTMLPSGHCRLRGRRSRHYGADVKPEILQRGWCDFCCVAEFLKHSSKLLNAKNLFIDYSGAKYDWFANCFLAIFCAAE